MERYRPELIIRGGIVFLHGVVAVVCLVYLLNVFQKAFKCFPVAVLIQKRREGLVEFVECFKSGEDVVGAAELLPLWDIPTCRPFRVQTSGGVSILLFSHDVFGF